MRSILATFLVSAVVFGGCNSTQMTSNPTPATLNVTGTWGGDVTFQDVTARMTWMLSQAGTNVSGPVLVALSSGTVLLNGMLMGTVSGSTLTYTISVGVGGIPSRPSCTGQLTGSMTVTIGAPSTMTGAPSVTPDTCAPPFSTKNVTLTR
jgi:hypothetical protein